MYQIRANNQYVSGNWSQPYIIHLHPSGKKNTHFNNYRPLKIYVSLSFFFHNIIWKPPVAIRGP